MSKIKLDVPYSERGDAKLLGARWDKDAKSWFAYAGSKIAMIYKWLPKEVRSTVDVRELSDHEVVRRFAAMPSRFENGQAVCKFLGLNPRKLVFVENSFCPMCDSRLRHEWTLDGKVELRHSWDRDDTRRINAKEEFFLLQYLDGFKP